FQLHSVAPNSTTPSTLSGVDINHDDTGDGYVTIKAIGIPLIFAANIMAGLLPLALRARCLGTGTAGSRGGGGSRLRAWMSPASCFSAGVFLASCFVGLLPSVRASFLRLYPGSHLPLTELSLMSGFFAVWALDLFAHWACSGHCCFSKEKQQQKQRQLQLPQWRKRQLQRQANGERMSNGDQLISSPSSADSSSVSLSGAAPLLADSGDEDENDAEETAFDRSHHQLQHHGHHHHDFFIGADSSSPAATMNAILLTLSMGVHSLLEGIGAGVSQSGATVLTLLAAMLMHESLCSLSLGVALLRGGAPPRLQACLVGLFSALIPAGLAIGLAIEAGVGSQTGESAISAHRAVAALQGLASGTFAYVIFIELLPPELAPAGNGEDGRSRQGVKFAATLIGFCLVAGISLGFGHRHGA
uniref:Zinc/iron permease n=1 Tax=Macrostomum lignano TaxID=282301 RepID=A0A1I8I2Q8_9PLAT